MKARMVLSAVCVCLMMVSCATMGNAPSVCDDIATPSLLCKVAGEFGVNLEDVGNAFVIANAVALAEGFYTKEQAMDVLIEFKSLINDPVSYLFVQRTVQRYMNRYPGLLQVAHGYVERFTSGRIMYRVDQDILRSWLTKQIDSLG